MIDPAALKKGDVVWFVTAADLNWDGGYDKFDPQRTVVESADKHVVNDGPPIYAITAKVVDMVSVGGEKIRRVDPERLFRTEHEAWAWTRGSLSAVKERLQSKHEELIRQLQQDIDVWATAHARTRESCE